MLEVSSGALLMLPDDTFTIKDKATITIGISEGMEQNCGFCAVRVLGIRRRAIKQLSN